MSNVTQEFSDGILAITIDRPDAYNSLDKNLRLELKAAFERAQEPDVRAVILLGGPKAFCTGQDLKEHISDLQSSAGMGKVVEEYNPMVAELTAINVPVIAAIEGAAAGAGWSLALHCDFRIAGPKASFKAAFPSIGLATDCGISYLLPQLVGPAKALQLLFDDQPVSAEAALELGLVTQVADGDDADAAAEEFARRLASGPTGSYREIKAMVKDAAAMLAVADLEGGAQKRLVNSVDHREAVEAFLNKRAPKFTGR